MKYVYNCNISQHPYLLLHKSVLNFWIWNQDAKRNCKNVRCAHQGWWQYVTSTCLTFQLKQIWLLEKIRAFDTQVLAIHNNQIITLPNCDFIPEPFIFDNTPLKPLHDGRFSVVDCFQWPQLHAEQYIWSACIPQQAVYQDDPVWSLLWWNLSRSPSEFVLEQGSTFKVGWVHLMKFQQLEAVYQCIDEHAQKWVTETPDYKGPIRVGDWMQICKWALMCLKVRCCSCPWHTRSVPNCWSRIWGSGTTVQGLEPWGPFRCSHSRHFYWSLAILLASNIHILWYHLGHHTVPMPLSQCIRHAQLVDHINPPAFQWPSFGLRLLDGDFHNQPWSLSVPLRCMCPSLACSEWVYCPVLHECAPEGWIHPPCCESKWSIGLVLQPKHNTKRQRMSCGLPVQNWTGVALKGVLHQGDWCSKRAEVPLACRGKEGQLELGLDSTWA